MTCFSTVAAARAPAEELDPRGICQERAPAVQGKPRVPGRVTQERGKPLAALAVGCVDEPALACPDS